MRGVRKNRYREATRTLQSGVPDNLRGCWSGLYPYASRSKYQSIKFLLPYIWQTHRGVYPELEGSSERRKFRGVGLLQSDHSSFV